MRSARLSTASGARCSSPTHLESLVAKEELVWLHEWTSPATLFAALGRGIAAYSRGYLHSALGYRSPESFEAEHLRRATPSTAACSTGGQYNSSLILLPKQNTALQIDKIVDLQPLRPAYQ
jgi:hypothetical protein